MNEKLNRELSYISLLFMVTTIILIVNTIENMFDELNKEIPFMGNFLSLLLALFYLSMIYSMMHDLLFPIKEKDKGQVTEKTYLFFTLINVMLFISILIANKHPMTSNIVIEVIPWYIILLSCYLAISFYILFLLFIKSFKEGNITKLDVKKIYIYVALFGLMAVSVEYELYDTFQNSFSIFPGIITLSILITNAFALVYLFGKEDSLFYYLLGLRTELRAENQENELSKSERNALIEDRITKRVLIISGLINMVVIVLFLGLVGLLLAEYGIIV